MDACSSQLSSALALVLETRSPPVTIALANGVTVSSLVVGNVVGGAAFSEFQRGHRGRGCVVDVDPRHRPGGAGHRQPPSAQRGYQGVAGRPWPVQLAVAQRDAINAFGPEHLLLVGSQGGEVGLEAAVAGRGERVGLGQHPAAPVAKPVAEHHRLG